jgi:hypothetical protein
MECFMVLFKQLNQGILKDNYLHHVALIKPSNFGSLMIININLLYKIFIYLSIHYKIVMIKLFEISNGVLTDNI